MADSNIPNRLTDLQYKDTYEKAEATARWLSEQDDSSIMISKGALIRDRVDFTGTTAYPLTVTDTELIRHRVASCREAYENSGMIGNAIDLMVDFALERLVIVHESLPVQRFYWQWAKRVNLSKIASEILKSYFIDGNVPVLSFRGRITNKEVRRFRKAVAGRISGTNAQKLFIPSDDILKKRIIPYKYAILDVMRLKQEGSELLGTTAWEYQLDAEDLKTLKDPNVISTSEAIRKLKIALGDRDFSHLAETGRLRIDKRRLNMLFYKKDGFKRWANPMLWRVIDDLKFKSLLRDMDISVSESVINALTIVKLGNTVEGFPPTKEMFQKVASLLKTPSKSQTLIWSDLIDMIAQYPPIEKILGEEKYKQVDNDIRQGLGISEAILGGSSQGGGKFANSFISVKTLIERLEGARQALVEWIKEQFDIVAKAMDFKSPAWCKLEFINLVDEAEEKRLMLELVDRGMISYQTCVERYGENFEIEIQRMKREDQFRRKNENKFPYVLVKTGKFGPSLSTGPVPYLDLLDSETLDSRQTQDADLIRERQEVEMDQLKNPPEPVQKAMPTQQGGQGDKGGRPSGTKKPQQKKQSPRNKPKGQDNSGKPSGKSPSKAAASNIEMNQTAFDEELYIGKKIFDKIYNSLSRHLIKSSDLKDGHEIRQEQREAIYGVIAKVIGEFDSDKQVTKENMEGLFKRLSAKPSTADEMIDNPELDGQVFEVSSKLIDKFKNDNGRNPNKNEIRDIIGSAFALSRPQNLKEG